MFNVIVWVPDSMTVWTEQLLGVANSLKRVGVSLDRDVVIVSHRSSVERALSENCRALLIISEDSTDDLLSFVLRMVEKFPDVLIETHSFGTWGGLFQQIKRVPGVDFEALTHRVVMHLNQVRSEGRSS